MNPRRLLLVVAASAWAVALAGCPGDDEPVRKATADAGAAAAKAKAKVAGKVESVKGAVTLFRAGSSGPASAQELLVGDALETAADGEAVLWFPGDRRVELGADGRFEVEEEGGGLVLTVERGLVLTRIPKAAAPAGGEVLLTIATPFGITRIGAGEVKLGVEKDGASVDVLVGEIELVSKSGEVTKLGAGASRRLGQPRELETIELAIVVTGRAEVKAKDAKRYVAINAKKPPKLTPGDAVRVKDGKLSLAPAGSATKLALAKGAEAVVGPSKRGAGVEETELALGRGELAVSAPAGQKTRVGVGGGVTLVSDLGGQFTVKKTADGFDVTSLAGEVRLERAGGEPLLVPGGGGAALGKKGAEVRQAAKEPVALPSRSGLKLFQAGVSRLSLTWDGADDKAWRVQVAADPGFSQVLVDGPVKARFLTVPVGPRGALYWRVYDGATVHEKGSVAYAPEPAAQDLVHVKNEVPEGPEKTTIYFQDKPPVVNFTWAKEAGAAQYKVVVFREGALGTPVIERTVAEAGASLPAGTLNEGRYLWSATPLGAKGDELRGGRMNKLEITYDNAVPLLVIKSPRNGEPGGKQVRVAGIAPVGSKVFVNGRAVALDEKSRFETTAAPLHGGRVVFRMLNAGTEVYTVRTVRGGR